MTEITTEKLIELQTENKKILLEIYGDWCAPCRMLMPKLESIEEKYSDISFLKMNIDKNKPFIDEMGIRSIPFVMFYDGKKLIDTIVGLNSTSRYEEILKIL